ncbi:MAG: stage II sporulation protein P [Clostridia bacterium]|nr:stage II sporulation protein P [Clostridia bacterium]
MVKVSVVSAKVLCRTSVKMFSIVVIFLILIGIINYSKIHFSKVQIETDKGISYLTDEITIMGDLRLDKIFRLTPTTILESELKASKSVSSRSEDFTQVENEMIVEDESNIEENVNNADDGGGEETVKEVATEATTEVQKSTYKEHYNHIVNGVKIKNETSFDLNEIELSPDNVKLKNKNVIIFHTHTCESYTQTENSKYEASGNYRTTDLNYNVAKVGDELEKYLKSYGFNVKHDKTYHDYPAYTGSYGRSLKTVSNILAKGYKADIIIDLHRDAMSDESYAPKVKIGDEYVSQLMFVIGTNGSGLEHSNWKRNLEYAIKVQEKANEMYPGLFKPIILRNARYNQHLSSKATIIEFGATGNTLEECEGAAKYLAKVLEHVE